MRCAKQLSSSGGECAATFFLTKQLMYMSKVLDKIILDEEDKLPWSPQEAPITFAEEVAMKYAEKVAVAFAEWLEIHAYPKGNKWYIAIRFDPFDTMPDLYQYFINNVYNK